MVSHRRRRECFERGDDPKRAAGRATELGLRRVRKASEEGRREGGREVEEGEERRKNEEEEEEEEEEGGGRGRRVPTIKKRNELTPQIEFYHTCREQPDPI